MIRISLFIILIVYLVALGFIMPSINEQIGINSRVNIEDVNYNIPQTDGEFTLISSIKELPLWFNTLFIIIPFILTILVGISLFFPIGNPGG